ncbi:hypothetical protein [Saccharopolyspora sp. 5N708]|uniref:hypothetical protein n=1 Tax=Saccharopolyspora sp. 5N708 TaxID=3457424 RepID=UPI003FD53B1C
MPPGPHHRHRHHPLRTPQARAWDRLHPRLTHRTAWATRLGNLPILEGTVIRLEMHRLPFGATPKPVWLWHSRIDLDPAMVDLLWQAFLRRFDIEHTFRLFKQTLGWTRPKLRTPEAADRWGWLILAAYTQLRLARGLASDLRRPWENPPNPRSSPRPGSDAGFGTYAREPGLRGRTTPMILISVPGPAVMSGYGGVVD